MAGEGEDVGFVLGVVEGDLALLVVDVNAHLLGNQGEGQGRGRVGAGVELPGAAPQGPVTLGGLHGAAAEPLRGGGGDPHSPVAVIGQFHLPVAASLHVPLPAQHTGPGIKALGAGRHVRLLQGLLHLLIVVRQQ